MKKATVSVNKDFERWAKGFSGCDGGNILGKVWLCGIEWGGGHDPDKLDFNREYEEYGKTVPYREDPSKISNVYDLNAYKLLSVIWENKSFEKDGLQYWEWVLQHKPFHKESQFFKMNLYPISFPDTNQGHWDNKWWEKTGFLNKQQYLLWCWRHRFPEIRNWVSANSPKLIVCVGKTYFTDFVLAFEGIDSVKWDNNLTHEVDDNDPYLSISWLTINEGKTILAVLPFLTNKYGLNSYERIEKAGLRLREICDAQFNNTSSSNWTE